MMPSLQVVIGLILIILFYSLLATTVMELLAGWLALRGRHLEKVLANLLASEEDTVIRKFKANPIYQQLAGRFFGKKTPPSYLSAARFGSILLQVLSEIREGRTIQEKIEQVPDRGLKQALQHLLTDAGYKMDEFRRRLEDWYDEVMDRASGWYKRRVQTLLLIIGVLIAVGFNADSVAIFSHLSTVAQTDPASLEQLVRVGEALATRESLTTATDSLAAVDPQHLDTLRQAIADLRRGADPLSVGWGAVRTSEMGAADWLLKVLGWLLTAVAVSLGAPFWFDLLKKVINIRSTGTTPVEEKVPAPLSGGMVVLREELPEDASERPVG